MSNYNKKLVITRKPKEVDGVTSQPTTMCNTNDKPDIKVRLTFYLSGAEAEQLRLICQQEDISISQKIRKHVKQLFQ